MPSIKKYPQTITQGTLTNGISWENTNNLKTNTSDYASTKLIKSSKVAGHRAKPLAFTNFKFNLPEGAKVTSIKLEYTYRKRAKTTNKNPAFAGPKIALKNSGISLPYRQATNGATLKTAFRASTNLESKTWNGKYQSEVITGGTTTQTVNGITTTVPKTVKKTIYYNLPSRNVINNADFGVHFNFFGNTTVNEGYIDFKTISLEVTYKLPSYGLKLTAIADNNEFIKDTPFQLQANITNTNLTSYSPTLQITVPEGTTITVYNMIGVVLTKISDTLYSFKVNLADTTGNVSTNLDTGEEVSTAGVGEIRGDVTINFQVSLRDTGTNTFTLTETYNGTAESISVDVIGQAIPSSDDVVVSSEQAIYAVQNTNFILPVEIPTNMIGETFYLYTEQALTLTIEQNIINVPAESFYAIPARYFDTEGLFNLTAKTSFTGIFNIMLNTEREVTETPTFIVKVAPEEFAFPRFVVKKLAQEQTDRLGDTYNYTVSADLRIICDIVATHVYQDYYRNFRLGVVNSIPETVNANRIFNACKNWSSQLSVFNDFENTEVEFTYHKEYPVYIIISANYIDSTCDLFELDFANLKLIESTREDGNEIYLPIPISDITSEEEESTALLTLPLNQISNNLIFYDFEVDELINDNLAIRGIGVRVHANLEDSTIIQAKMINGAGVTSERSVLAQVTGTEHVIGSATDRWGFNISELQEIDKFELELNFSNTKNETTEISIDKVELLLYYNYYESQLVDWIVEDENMAGLNAFLTNVVIPEGLETAVKYLDVDGTDTNVAFRQTIKGKEITVEFDVDECNIDDAVSSLQAISEFLQTERDSLYRPIPKKVRFSHYPGIYWEYILEEPINAEVEGASSFSCKVKLTIPAGTAYTDDEITTGKSGRVGGLAKVNPIITVTPTEDHIELEEILSGQKFMMTYNTWTSDDIVEIDCENRRITLIHSDDTTEDITAYADFNTNWFLLFKEFSIEDTGCTLQSVTWTERR